MSIDVRGAIGATPERSNNVRAVFPAPSASRPPDRHGITQVVFVAQRADCSGNLLLANLMARNAIRDKTGAIELVISGKARDTLGMRTDLPFALRHSPIRLLTAHERSWLHSVGHHETPVLLLFDHDSRLRLASQVEADPVARVALGRAIVHLVTQDPSR